MRTRISTITYLKQLFVEAFLNNTNNVSKVSDGSVLSGTAFGVGKVIQKVQKDVALIEARKFPSSAFGIYLDDVGYEYGVSDRFGATLSSTYLLLVGSIGTTYLANTHFFTGDNNVTFELVANITIPAQGYTYALVRSTSTGSRSNVDPLTINAVAPVPSGHTYVINEYGAIGATDAETDDDYRLRIRDMPNIASTDTLGRLTQVFIKINPKVLRLFYYGINGFGQTIIGVLTQDGSPLSGSELNALVVMSSQYLALSDLQSFGSSQYGIITQNIDWNYVDIDFRADIDVSFVSDDVRKNIQIALTKYLDYTRWTAVSIAEWATMLAIVQSIDGLKYCPDTYFFPRVDVITLPTQLPRVRGFIMRDMNGNIISDGSGNLNPLYFPNRPINSYQNTVIITA